jgi:hypothetical protein
MILARHGVRIRQAFPISRLSKLLLVVLGAAQPSLQAQFGWLKPAWMFERHTYYDPLSAEPRAAEMKVLFPARSSSVPFAVNPGQSFVWDITVGDEIPIAGWTSSTVKPEGQPVPQKSFGIGVWFPISFHLIEDLNKDPSAPPLDTDYRFGAMIKAQWGLPALWGKIHDGHIGLRYVPIAHESTHLGDEFTLSATQTYRNKFERVNVSYQYWELGGSFEPNFLKDGHLKAKFRGGYIHEAFHKGIGWYDTDLLLPIGGSVTASNRNFEPYAGVELFLRPDPPGFGPFVSVDFRDRTVYGYHRAARSVPEDTQGSVDVMVGARQIRRTSKIEPSYYLRYYHGVNPAGQFRSQTNYQLYGLGILFKF